MKPDFKEWAKSKTSKVYTMTDLDDDSTIFWDEKENYVTVGRLREYCMEWHRLGMENKEKEILRRVDRLIHITKHVETSKEFEAVFRANFWDLLA